MDICAPIMRGGGEAAAPDFLLRDAIADFAEAAAAVFLGKNGPEQAEFADFADQITRDFLVLVDRPAMGLISALTNSRTMSRSMFCSSVNWKRFICVRCVS
jgi:hypothetical protein